MNQPSDTGALTGRIDRLTPEGRIAWHTSQAQTDHAAHLLAVARDAVEALSAATERLAA